MKSRYNLLPLKNTAFFCLFVLFLIIVAAVIKNGNFSARSDIQSEVVSDIQSEVVSDIQSEESTYIWSEKKSVTKRDIQSKEQSETVWKNPSAAQENKPPIISATRATEISSSSDSGETEADESSRPSDEQFDKIIDDLISGLDTDALEEFFNNYQGAFSDGLSLKEKIKAIVSGDLKINYDSIFALLFDMFFGKVYDLLPMFSLVAVTAVFCGLMSSVQSGRTQMNDVVFLCGFGVIVFIIFTETTAVISESVATIQSISRQTEAIFPVLFTLVTVCGGSVSAAIYRPACVFLAGGIIKTVTSVLIPVIVAVAVLSVLSNLSDKYPLKRLKEFFTGFFKWTVGSLIAVFSIFMTVQGISAGTYDGVALRALKYAVGSSVPMLGSFVREGVDLVLCGSVLIKNAVGNIVILLIFSAIFSPLAEIICFSLMLKLISAVIEPLADARICSAVSSFSHVLSMLAAVIIMVFIMYFLTIVLIICTQSAVAV